MNVLEITQSNTLQIRNLIEYKDGKVVVARKFHRYCVDSTQTLTTEVPLVRKIAKAFPFIPTVQLVDGVHYDIANITITANDLSTFAYVESIHIIEGGVTVVHDRRPTVIVTSTDDISELPAKVRKVAGLIFKTRV